MADGCYSGLTRSASRSAGGQYTLPTATGTACTHNLQHRGNETNQLQLTKNYQLSGQRFIFNLLSAPTAILSTSVMPYWPHPTPLPFPTAAQLSCIASISGLSHRRPILASGPACRQCYDHIACRTALLAPLFLVWMARYVCGYVGESIVSKSCVYVCT